jgi:thioesterase domain-containing protein
MPVYGLELTDLDCARSIESLASYHLRKIRAIQKEGPYRIAGYSAGGIVAYEIANQLLGAEQAVDFLGLIDTTFPTPVVDKTAQAAWMAQAESMARARVDFYALQAKMEVTKALMAAIDGYCVEKLHIPTTLFSAAQNSSATDRSEPQWRELLGDNLHVYGVRGDHLSMVAEPYVESLAESMSAALRPSTATRKAAPLRSPTIPLRSPRSAAATFFCAPGAGASATCFWPLAAALPSSISVVGLQPRGLDGMHVPHSSVEVAAQSFLEAILKTAPNGPYRLLGHSFGGWLVFEIARQLESRGEQLLPIILLDTDPPSLDDDIQGKYSRCKALSKFARILDRTAGRSLGFDVRDFEGLDANAQVEKLLRAMRETNLLPRSATTPLLRSVVRAFSTSLNTVYVPPTRLNAEVYLFQTDDINPDDEDFIPPAEAVRRWRSFAPNLTVLPAQGNHVTMLQIPSIYPLADLIRRIWAIDS